VKKIENLKKLGAKATKQIPEEMLESADEAELDSN
jgi:hypothetical protein